MPVPFSVAAQYLLPHHLLSRIVGYLTHARQVTLKNALIRAFIHHYNVDMTEALETDPTRYPDFNSFFTRALKPEARPLAPGDHVVSSPADAVVSQRGNITQGRFLQAKGFELSVLELLGGDPEKAALFEGGKFATLYLSPRDYHRVHMPVAGTLKHMIYVPGRIFSVNPLTTDHVPHLFTRNERVVCLFETAYGPMAVVLVGALLCASIATVWHGTVTPPQRKQVTRCEYADHRCLDRGEEMGRFFLGSTVILLFGPQAVQWDSEFAPCSKVKCGERVGHLLSEVLIGE